LIETARTPSNPFAAWPTLDAPRQTSLEQSILSPNAPLPTDVHRNYGFGVRFATDLGLIQYASLEALSRRDFYAHFRDPGLLTLTAKNSRVLSPLGRVIARYYRNEDTPKILDLGAGSGVVASKLARILPHASLETVGLTPINPFLRFRRSVEPLQTGSPDNAELLDMLYEKSPTPFIHKQYLGLFPEETALPNGNFHYIHELFGPIFHYQPSSAVPTPENLSAAVVNALHFQGTLYIARIKREMMKPFVEAARKCDSTAACTEVGSYWIPGLVIARSLSPLWPILRQFNNYRVSRAKLFSRLSDSVPAKLQRDHSLSLICDDGWS
jgi:hypothetical protein